MLQLFEVALTDADKLHDYQSQLEAARVRVFICRMKRGKASKHGPTFLETYWRAQEFVQLENERHYQGLVDAYQKKIARIQSGL